MDARFIVRELDADVATLGSLELIAPSPLVQERRKTTIYRNDPAFVFHFLFYPYPKRCRKAISLMAYNAGYGRRRSNPVNATGPMTLQQGAIFQNINYFGSSPPPIPQLLPQNYAAFQHPQQSLSQQNAQPPYQHPNHFTPPNSFNSTTFGQTFNSQPTPDWQNRHQSGYTKTTPSHHGIASTIPPTPPAQSPVVYSNLGGSQGSSAGSTVPPHSLASINADPPSTFAHSEGNRQHNDGPHKPLATDAGAGSSWTPNQI
ncbi:hypothetical protein CJF30_00005179 [Rutstroemia sp. NJR-2017a BBW]|nr:hypothetical protein CJF30_00005179 [Rutstroemia sp. NJR-2017a BBW]